VILFYACVNIILCIGLGIGLRYCTQSDEHSVSEHSASMLRRFVTVVLAVTVAQASEIIPIPTELPVLLIYSLVAVKIGTIIFLIVVAGLFTGTCNHDNAKRM